MNNWWKPCEHGYWIAHYFHRNENPYEAVRCPGRVPVTSSDLEALGREVVDLLVDIIQKATPYGIEDGDFVANYILPTGPIHRALAFLRGIHAEETRA